MAAKVAMPSGGGKRNQAGTAGGGALLVAVRAQPRARRASVGGGVADGSGRMRLRIAVTEPAEGGRASQAVCNALARALDVAPSRVGLHSGGTSRDKLLRVDGDPARLEARLRALLEQNRGTG